MYAILEINSTHLEPRLVIMGKKGKTKPANKQPQNTKNAIGSCKKFQPETLTKRLEKRKETQRHKRQNGFEQVIINQGHLFVVVIAVWRLLQFNVTNRDFSHFPRQIMKMSVLCDKSRFQCYTITNIP